MKRRALLSLCCVMTSLLMAQQVAHREVTFEVTNPYHQLQTDAPVVINLHTLKLKFHPASAVVTCDGEEIPSQLDDLNRDGVVDELAWVMDIPAQHTKQLTVSFSSEQKQPHYPARTFAQMLIRDGKKNKHAQAESITVPGTANVYNLIYGHGPMMESELVGYRIYFNQKQTLDPYGKFRKRLELEDCSFYPSDKQLAAGFGDDVLMVGNSCGIGALKGWDGTQATHIEPIASRTERVVTYGPVRTILEVEVKQWNYQGDPIDMIQRYTLYAGHRDLQIECFFATPLQEQTFATGVQRIMGTETVMESDHEGLVGSWGRHWPVTDTVKYAKETIGIATYIPQSYIRKEVSDKDNYLYLMAAPQAQHFHYYTMFTSRKEEFGYPDAASWFAYMKEWKAQLQHPLQVKRKR